MPKRNKTEQRIRNLVNNGYSFGQAISAVARGKDLRVNLSKAAVRGYRVGRGVVQLVKQRKGGIIMKQNKAVFVPDGRYPYTQRQFNRMGPGGAARTFKNRQAVRNRKSMNVGSRNARPGRTIAMKQMKAVRNSTRPRLGAPNASMITFNHTESIAGIVSGGGGTADPDIFIYQINPGLRALMPWGGQVAYNFQYYKVIQMSFRLVSNCSSTSTGRWAIACDYNPYYNTSLVTNIDYMMQLNGRQGDVKDHIPYSIVPSMNKRNQSGGLLIRGGEIPNGNDSREYDLGNLYIGIESTQQAQIGNLEVTYTLQLRDARPNVDSLGMNGSSTSKPSTASPFSTQTYMDISLNMPASYTAYTSLYGQSNGFQFNCNYKGLIEFYVNGTGMSNEAFSTTEEDDSPYLLTPSITNPNTLNVDLTFIRSLGTNTDRVQQYWVDAIAGGTIGFTQNVLGDINLIRLWVTPATQDLDANSSNVILNVTAPVQRMFRPIMAKAITLDREKDALTQVLELRNQILTDKYERKVSDEEDSASLVKDMDVMSVTSKVHSITPKIIDNNKKKKQIGIDTYIKGGNCDQNALKLLFCLMAMLVFIVNCQIFPPFSKYPTTRKPSKSPTSRPSAAPTRSPTKYPTTPRPTNYFFRSSLLSITGTDSAPLTTVVEKVPLSYARMFTKINATSFTLAHDGLVLVSYIYVSVGGTFGIPAYYFYHHGDTYDNYYVMTDCERSHQMSMVILNMTHADKVVTMRQKSGTTGSIGISGTMSFTPIGGFMLFGPYNVTSVCASGCSIVHANQLLTL